MPTDYPGTPGINYIFETSPLFFLVCVHDLRVLYPDHYLDFSVKGTTIRFVGIWTVGVGRRKLIHLNLDEFHDI